MIAFVKGCQFKLQTSNPQGPADVDVEASFKFEIHGVLGVIFAESRTSVEVRCNDRIVGENRES